MSKFQIVELKLDGSTTPLPEFGQFEDGKDATSFIKSLLPHTTLGRKFQVRPIADQDDWRERELKKFETGEYTRLCWEDRVTPIVDHFAHVSKKNSNEVAFTENLAKGLANIQKRLPVNRYLSTFYPEMPVQERRIISYLHRGEDLEAPVHFATTPDDIERVYTDGPESCMSGSESNYGSPWHPVRAYGAGDLAVAYLRDSVYDGCVAARTVVWPAKRIYGRIYSREGDDEESGEKLEHSLQLMGYTYDYMGFAGARLISEYGEGENDEGDFYEGFVAPYLDCVQYASLNESENAFIINPAGNYLLQGTCGYANETYAPRCPCCNKYTGNRNFLRNPKSSDRAESALVCYPCAEATGVACVVTGAQSGLVALPDGRAIHSSRYDTHTFVCPVTGEHHLKRDGVYRDGTYYSPNLKEQAA